MKRYRGYFRRHFGVKFNEGEIKNYRKWFYPQWKFINSKIKIGKSSRILELGSGSGGFYSFLDNPANYTGLELDEEAVNFSNKYFGKRFRNVSLENFWSYPKYDYVFAFEVLEHLRDPVSAIGKIFGLLRTGGFLIGTSPYPFIKNIKADSTHIYVLHPANWRKLFLETGFRKVDIYPMSFFPFLWRLFPGFNIRIPFYVPLPGFISTTLFIARK